MVSILTCSKYVMWLFLLFILTIFGKILNWKINKKSKKKKNVSLFKNVQCTNILSTKLSIMKMARNLKMATKINTAARVWNVRISLVAKSSKFWFLLSICLLYLLFFILLSFNCPAIMLNIKPFHKIEIIFLFRLAPVSKIYHYDELNK